MSLSEQYLETEDLHPIDIVETLATFHDWDFDRVADDQIAMAIEGQWRTYSVTLAWSGYDETLRMICTFDMEPPEDKLPALYETLNLANDKCWAGAFSYWADQKLMVYRYGLVLAGDQIAGADQIACMVETPNGIIPRSNWHAGAIKARHKRCRLPLRRGTAAPNLTRRNNAAGRDNDIR
jgi:hypothetical protein